MSRAMMRGIREKRTMVKLLKAFNEAPTQKNAARLLKHLTKHPMSACFIDQSTIDKAKEVAA